MITLYILCRKENALFITASIYSLVMICTSAVVCLRLFFILLGGTYGNFSHRAFCKMAHRTQIELLSPL